MFKFYIVFLLSILSLAACKEERPVSKEIVVSKESDSLKVKPNVEVTTPSKATSWLGSYSCNFLRMKDESADPRAWGMIRINIKKDSAKFGLDTYIENFERELRIVNQTENEIILSLKNQKDSTFVISKKGKKYLLKSNFINETVGENETYELIKE